MTRQAITVRSPRQVLFGEGELQQVGDVVAHQGRRVSVITDAFVAAQPYLAALLDELDQRAERVSIYSEVMPDLPVSDVALAVEAAEVRDADVILAIGGGTVIDLAKASGVVARHGGHPRDFYGEALVPGPIPPLIAVPTTAGTGSEVSPVAVLSDPERELKVGVSSLHLVPDVALIDPELTLTCPPPVTAYSGIDAFCHAVESYTSRPREELPDLVGAIFQGRNPVTDEAALRAVSAIAPNLARAVEDGDDRLARNAMAAGAMWAGVAFSHAGTACPHALQYPLGALTKTPHGLGVGLLLPYALTAARTRITDRLATLARTVGIDEERDDLASDRFLDWIVELLRQIGVPPSLADIGVSREDLPKLAEKTMDVGRLLQNHPGPRTVDAMEAILEAAWFGDRDRLTSPAA